ncbi:DUF3224 domain-containing protein [Brachybacterium sp. J144]|uniref:DUF3224 domain-containing protein n=1 Tax=Brachybacterium sp. J144 TaxID=3116487 RepID=UPI002E779921|nr:DUF3224 domain-containing protein [Brachybacterium sp. J144]MEE1649812.1 DUF3224 domain-containing protein [Brachybacterium sp. J144]
MTTLTATFTIAMTPGDRLHPAEARLDLEKTWTGDLDGTSRGLMLTAGDPATGSAGYVALERFEGTIGGRRGAVTLLQLGTMAEGEPELRYAFAPGSGTGELAGLTGTLEIGEIDDAGVHTVSITLG